MLASLVFGYSALNDIKQHPALTSDATILRAVHKKCVASKRMLDEPSKTLVLGKELEWAGTRHISATIWTPISSVALNAVFTPDPPPVLLLDRDWKEGPTQKLRISVKFSDYRNESDKSPWKNDPLDAKFRLRIDGERSKVLRPYIFKNGSKQVSDDFPASSTSVYQQGSNAEFRNYSQNGNLVRSASVDLYFEIVTDKGVPLITSDNKALTLLIIRPNKQIRLSWSLDKLAKF